MVFELCSLYYNGGMTTVEKLRRNGISFRFDELRRVAQAYHIADIAVFGSRVHIVEPESLTNPVRRRSILSSTETLYA
jgi:hypothetical protein